MKNKLNLPELESKKVFAYFEELAAIPHGSRNTRQISDYLISFAKEHGLECYQDEANNVVIIQEASDGYESADPIIMQGHMDMVCEKEKGVEIDFEKDGLELYVDGDFLKAKGTTLGGDDGVAVAYILAIMDSPEIAHPRLEAVITVDEEIGMLGAEVIDLSMLKGHKMLNIDSDVEGHFLTSCAGGMTVDTVIPVTWQKQQGYGAGLSVTGLEGGHSGSEIDKEHANANILMGRVLRNLFDETPFGIISLAGGLKDNAIPRECVAEILLPEENVNLVKEIADNLSDEFKKEFSVSDPDVGVEVHDLGASEADILDFGSVSRVIFYLRSVPNGVQNMSQVNRRLVETSLNLGIMELQENALYTVTSIRSSVGTRKADLLDRVTAIVELLGGEAEVEGDYPAWEYKQDSLLRPQVAKVYEKLYGKEPVFETIHAGLECGLLSEKIKDLDCVSFGPDNFDIHTPKERLSISSTGRVWDFIVEFLKQAK